jgi:branched-chain amino acid transport system permease protein
VKLLLVSIILVGLLYSLQALGFVLVIRGTGVLNFAQGQMLALGAYITWGFAQNAPTRSGFIKGLAVMLVVMVVLGVLMYRVILARLEGAPIWAVVMALFGIGAILDAVIQIQWGSAALFLNLPVPVTGVQLPFGVISNPLDLSIAGGSAAIIIGLLALVYLTPLGLRMRASAENKALAAYAGVSIRSIGIISWALAAGMVGLAGLALALRTTVSPELELAFLTAFPAVVLGGFESIVGAVVASFLLAAIVQFGVYYFGSPIAVPLAYVVLLATLLIRPQGLFGARDIVRI